MKVSLKKLNGNWKIGYALDKHTTSSTFTGYDNYGHKTYDTIRPEAGEALYQLKYNRRDAKQAPLLAAAIYEHILPRFSNIGFIVPMPPSTKRAMQPVFEVAKALSEQSGIPCFQGILRSIGGEPLKNIGTRAAKIAAMQDRLSLHDTITNQGCWNVLLIYSHH